MVTLKKVVNFSRNREIVSQLYELTKPIYVDNK